MKEKKNRKILSIIFVISLLLDQITKFISYKKQFIAQNSNGLAQNREYLIMLSIVIIMMILRYMSNNNTFIKLDTRIILTLAISGISGNLIDRIWNIEPLMFIKITNQINLNLAYIYIIIAWIGMAFILTKNTSKMLNAKRVKKNENQSK